MKLEKYYLIFGVITVILCVTASSQAEVLEPDETILIAPANPALAGIKVLNVVVAIRPTEQSKSGLDGKSLKAKVEQVLEKAGIKISLPSPTGDVQRREGVNYDMDISSDLKVSIEILDLADSQSSRWLTPQCVLRVQTSLSRGVCLIEQSSLGRSPAQPRNLAFKADVWTAEPVMRIAPLQNISAKVTEVVISQVETFIQAYTTANAVRHPQADTAEGRTPDVPLGTPNGANDTAPKKLSEGPRAKSVLRQAQDGEQRRTIAEYKYVASKNSEVFHTPNCRSAKRISPENMVIYKTREEAIKAGKRPCKVCTP
jgi:hypothetical protein